MRVNLLMGAMALVVWVALFPPTLGTTVVDTMVGAQTVSTVARASILSAPNSIGWLQLVVEIGFILATCAWALVRTRNLTGESARIEACALASHSATAAFCVLPFGYGIATSEVGLMVLAVGVWGMPLLWGNIAAVVVAQRARRSDRPGPGPLLLGALWLASGAWVVMLGGAWLLGEALPNTWWLFVGKLNSGSVAACLAVLFATLAGTLRRVKTASCQQ